MDVAQIIDGLVAASINGRTTDAEHHFGPNAAAYNAAKDEVLGRADHEDSNEEQDAGTGNVFDAWGTTESGEEWRIKLYRLAI